MARSGTKWSESSKAVKSRSSARSGAKASKSAGSSRHGGRGAKSGKNITVVPRGGRSEDKTDWAAVDALTDSEIEAAIASDQDWAEFRDVDWSDAVLVMPGKKVPISIRVDPDVLDFFKDEGPGYQRRINQVLRSYVEHRKKTG